MEAVTVEEEEANLHYILRKVTPADQQKCQSLGLSKIPDVDSIALFSIADDLIPDSAGVGGENPMQAVRRLQSKFKSLLAARLVKLTLNSTLSRLSISMAMETIDGNQLVTELQLGVVDIKFPSLLWR